MMTIKSDFYNFFSSKDTTTGKTHPKVFFVRNETFNRAFKLPIASVYSASTMRDLESPRKLVHPHSRNQTRHEAEP
jgi:hypothetical protein